MITDEFNTRVKPITSRNPMPISYYKESTKQLVIFYIFLTCKTWCRIWDGILASTMFALGHGTLYKTIHT